MIEGRLTKDPAIRENNDKAVGKFTLAVNRTYKKDEADFISCTAFGKQATFLETYVRKGDLVQIRGHIQTGSYNNKEGKAVYTTDVIVDEINFAPTNNRAERGKYGFEDAHDEGLPFE